MTLLFRYLFLQNVLYMFIALLVGTGIYVLADLFDRIDNFMDAGVSFLPVAWYYVMRLPSMIAVILPVCFLLATLAQLSIMARSRETVALLAGGISFLRIAAILLCCGFVCGTAQFVFSQAIGVQADRLSRAFWDEDVQKRNMDQRTLYDVWFEDGSYKVHLRSFQPGQKRGLDVTAYLMTEDGQSVARVLNAHRLIDVEKGAWVLGDITAYNIGEYSRTTFDSMTLPLQLESEDFEWYDVRVSKVTLSLWELGDTIRAQQAAGSNVEELRTAWHMKLSSAASLMVLALFAVAVVTWRDNIYLCIGIGLAATFILYVLSSLSPTLSAYGILNPIWAAWYPNILFFLAAMARLVWFHWPHRLNGTADTKNADPAPG